MRSKQKYQAGATEGARLGSRRASLNTVWEEYSTQCDHRGSVELHLPKEYMDFIYLITHLS